jgi:predicted 2-oxoglutarate/Fe(II)-dependent dioxygenase YbiX
MGIKDYIQITDGNLPIETVSSFIKFCNKVNYIKGGLSEQGIINETVRKVGVHPLSKLSASKTEVHWTNLMISVLKRNIESYKTKFSELEIQKILDISILKYQDSGHYDWHTDHSSGIPRTMSFILLLNNEYIGGGLSFKDSVTNEEINIETKPGRMISWPSNFMFPHKVNPVESGTRYSVVSWAL